MQKKNQEENSNVEREGWKAEEIAEEAANKESDEITRQMLRGDESKGDPDERDVAGGVDADETPHGNKEVKHQTGSDKQQ